MLTKSDLAEDPGDLLRRIEGAAPCVQALAVSSLTEKTSTRAAVRDGRIEASRLAG